MNTVSPSSKRKFSILWSESIISGLVRFTGAKRIVDVYRTVCKTVERCATCATEVIHRTERLRGELTRKKNNVHLSKRRNPVPLLRNWFVKTWQLHNFVSVLCYFVDVYDRRKLLLELTTSRSASVFRTQPIVQFTKWYNSFYSVKLANELLLTTALTLTLINSTYSKSVIITCAKNILSFTRSDQLQY